MSDQWAAAQRLVGRWAGIATGQPGTGTQLRTYQPILGGLFLMATNRTAWEPTDAEPEGEIHEDLAILGLDRATDQLVMRAFFGEGFACEYRCVERGADGDRLVLQADRVENGGAMRARETLVLHGADELESTFELAQGDGPFAVYTVERLRRVVGT